MILKEEKINGHWYYFEKRDWGTGHQEVAVWKDKPNCGSCLVGYYPTKDDAIESIKNLHWHLFESHYWNYWIDDEGKRKIVFYKNTDSDGNYKVTVERKVEHPNDTFTWRTINSNEFKTKAEAYEYISKIKKIEEREYKITQPEFAQWESNGVEWEKKGDYYEGSSRYLCITVERKEKDKWEGIADDEFGRTVYTNTKSRPDLIIEDFEQFCLENNL